MAKSVAFVESVHLMNVVLEFSWLVTLTDITVALVCGTLATTKAEAAATLNYLPDHNNSPEAIAATCRGI